MPSLFSSPENGGAGGFGRVPKWVLGLVIGVPVAAGLAYVLFGEYGDDNDSSEKNKASSDKEQIKKKIKEFSGPLVEGEAGEEEEKNPNERRSPLECALGLKEKGNTYFRKGRYELAIKCYTKAITTCPPENETDLSNFYQNRAAAYDQLVKVLSRENLGAVLKDCDMALAHNQKYVKALARRTKACLKLAEKEEDLDKKVEFLNKALEDSSTLCSLNKFSNQDDLINLDCIVISLGLAEATRTARFPIKESKTFVQQFFGSFARDPLILERNSYENLLNGINGYTLSGYLRAREAFDKENYHEIIPFCNEELQDSNTGFFVKAKLLRATFCILSRRQNQGLEDLNDIIELDTANPDYRVNALIKRARLNDFLAEDKTKVSECFKDFQRAEEIQPYNEDIYMHRGQLYLCLGDFDLAIKDFRKALELNPNFSIAEAQETLAEFRKSLLEENNSEVQKCLDQFEVLMKKFPKCIETSILYAKVLCERQNFERGDEIFKLALKVDPLSANIRVQRGLIQLQWKGDEDAAVKLIESAVEIDDSFGIAWDTLACLELRRANYSKAVDYYDKAISLCYSREELVHMCSLKYASIVQLKIERLSRFEEKKFY